MRFLLAAPTTSGARGSAVSAQITLPMASFRDGECAGLFTCQSSPPRAGSWRSSIDTGLEVEEKHEEKTGENKEETEEEKGAEWAEGRETKCVVALHLLKLPFVETIVC